jgi:1-deoxy-D-xylulose-5-phosphate reductoisomerase
LNIAVLGSTGSIGTQALDVIASLGYAATGLSAGKNIELLSEQIAAFQPQIVSVENEEKADELKKLLTARRIFPLPEIVYGETGVIKVAVQSSADRVLAAISGFAGMPPVLAAVRAGIDVALANKETLVSAGELVMAEAKAKNVAILPVDSEHAAIFQCLQGKTLSPEDKIFLTCSGGPFFGKRRQQLVDVSVEDALSHPTWNMGRKISIDSATLMNKALEVIEAVRLFAAKASQVDVVIHKESVIHSMVSFADRSVLAQLGLPDMRLAIFQALTYPETKRNDLLPVFDPFDPRASSLTFAPVDAETFPAIELAKEALSLGGLMPLVLNAANEAAVALFLEEKITFFQIYDIISRSLATYRVWSATTSVNPDDMMDLHRGVMEDIRRST